MPPHEELTACARTHGYEIAWDGMDEPSDAMMPSLKDRLTRLSKAISSNVDGGIREWDVRKKGDVYGNTMRDIL